MTTSTRLALLTAIAVCFAAGYVAAQSLDFATYRAKVEPVFLKKREGHARCIVCHAGAANSFHLEPLASVTPASHPLRIEPAPSGDRR